MLQNVWSSGRALQVARTAAGCLDMVLAAVQSPAAIVAQDGELIARNGAMQSFLEDAAIAVQRGGRLGLPADLPIGMQEGAKKLDLARTAPTGHRGEVMIKAYKNAQFTDGEARDMFLLSIEPRNGQAMDVGLNVWEVEGLTEREQMLVRLVAEGMKFSEAQIEMGVSYPRVMQIWKSARQKLDVDDVNELRLSHLIRQA